MTAELVVAQVSLLAEMAERLRSLDRPSLASALAEALERGSAFLESIPPTDSEREGLLDPIVARAGYDLLRHRALMLAERESDLARQVEALAGESLVLHDGLWQAHERSSRLKVVLGRRRAVTMRPDAPLTIGGSGRRRPGTADRVLANLAREQCELTLPAGLVERATAAAAQAAWYDARFDDALLLVMAHGLAAIEAERSPTAQTSNADPPLEPLAHRVFDLQESIRILEIRENAFRIDNGGMRLRLAQLEAEIEQLEREVAAARGARADSKRGAGKRLLGRLLRRNHGEQ